MFLTPYGKQSPPINNSVNMKRKRTYQNVQLVERPPSSWTTNTRCDFYTEFDFITTEKMPTWQPVKDGRIAESEGDNLMEMPDGVEVKLVWIDKGVRIQPTWGVVWFQPGYNPEPEGLVGVFGNVPLDGMFLYDGPEVAPTQMFTTHLPGAGESTGGYHHVHQTTYTGQPT
jgi:hypothetical protein